MVNKIRVLVVDDSGYVVSTVTKRLQSDPEIEVIDSAHNGIQAIEKIKSLRPDVVTMDIIMPEMDGLNALKYIMAECPVPVVMLSALTSENAEPTIMALEYGAVDFFLKPSALKPDGNNDTDDTLISKVKMAARMDVASKKQKAAPVSVGPAKKNKVIENPAAFNKLVLIGSSTGGPRALMQVVPNLPEDISAGILLVQHMPPLFTKSLADRLNLTSKIKVEEAREGDEVQRGVALMAPGDYHMVVKENGKIHLNQDRPVQGVRPSIDVTLKSVAGVYKEKSVGVILTGMGVDGTEGSVYVKAAGGKMLAQDQEGCTVFGMPAGIINAGRADKVVPLPRMAAEIIKLCRNQE